MAAETARKSYPVNRELDSGNCHGIEADVRRQLLAVDGVKVSSLVVRRLPNGVCLQGVLTVDDDAFDLCETVRKVPGVKDILNHMVMQNG